MNGHLLIKLSSCTHDFNLSSFNCRNVKSSVNEIKELCNCNDIVFLQETWLTNDDLPFLNAIDENFYAKGVSAVSTDDKVLKGRTQDHIMRQTYTLSVTFQYIAKCVCIIWE